MFFVCFFGAILDIYHMLSSSIYHKHIITAAQPIAAKL